MIVANRPANFNELHEPGAARKFSMALATKHQSVRTGAGNIRVAMGQKGFWGEPQRVVKAHKEPVRRLSGKKSARGATPFA